MDFDEAVDEEGNFVQDDWLVKARNKFIRAKVNPIDSAKYPNLRPIGSKMAKFRSASTSGDIITPILADNPIKDTTNLSPPALFVRKARKFCRSNMLSAVAAIQLDPRGSIHQDVHEKNWARTKTYNLTDMQSIIVCLYCVGLMGVAISPLVQVSNNTVYKYISTIRNKLGYDKHTYYTPYDFLMGLKQRGFSIIRKQYTHGVQRTLKSQLTPVKEEVQMDDTSEMMDASPEYMDGEEVEGGYNDEEADI